MSDDPPPLAFVDLETTGGTATVDRITEIAIVTVDGDRIERWSRLVNPETRIPPFIEQLTGISNALVAEAPTFDRLAAEILERLAGRLFIAHNARFDYAFLKNEYRRLGHPFRMPVLCTVRLSRKLYPQHRRHGLDQLIERHGLDVTDRHRALGDAQAICDFWHLARRDADAATFARTLKELTARPALPPHLDPDALDDLPDRCGVYLFYGENELPLYVGKSKQIRSRVMAHFAGDHSAAKEMSISNQVRRIEWIECAGEIEALLNESRLIKEMQPILNRQLRRNREYCAWQLIDQGFGHLQPRLVHARDLEANQFGRQDGLYGLFASVRSANDWMAALAKDHELCLATLGLEKVPGGKPCFARQLHRCRGACVGEEPILQHGIRLIEALGRTKLVAWPFAGPAALAEGEALHLIDAWCYLGTARTADDVDAVLAGGRPQFDRDTYRILVRHLDRMQPLRTPR